MTRVRHLLEWILLATARRAIRCLPRRAALALGAVTGEIAYRFGIRRRVVLSNLALAFPEWTATQCRRVARRMYQNTGRTFVECLLLVSPSPDQIDRMVEGVEGREFLEWVGGVQKPFIVVTGHVDNWELMGAYFARHGFRLKVIAKPLHNPRVEAALLAMRQSCGYEVLYTGEGLKPGLRHLRDGGVLVFLADQDARRAGIAVPFFGAPASTALGPAVFALLARVPILPVFALRVGKTRHRFRFFPPIEPPLSEKREVALERLTYAHVEVLEHIVRKYPEQYFWFHRRWKTPPQKTRGGK
ncbi:hypothetical protein AMJ85_06540 [candidate division BRC1 bacterium SM23_51]|nr:MAG: hypothetical protein AMJ85_06540 [candidate division BRC1 bacterium SM23_51]